MEREEKVFFIIEQIRLCLAKKDFIRAEIISKKISTKFFFADTDNIQVYTCTCVYTCISVFSLGYKSSQLQPHPLTTPIAYTLIMLHVAALYVKLLLYRSDVHVQTDYLIQTSLFKLLHCSSTETLYCRSNIKQAEITKMLIQRTILLPI